MKNKWFRGRRQCERREINYLITIGLLTAEAMDSNDGLENSKEISFKKNAF